MNTTPLKFYEYHQNNSGGSFEYDEERGISVIVIVQATSADHANRRAEQIGLYFDGDGDCDCCGYRWSEQWSDDGTDEPTHYGTPITDPRATPRFQWVEGFEGFVHYFDGSKVGIFPHPDMPATITASDV